MTKNTIFSIACFALVIAAGMAIKGCVDGRNAADGTRAAYKAATDTIRRYKDQYGTEHAQRLAAEGDLSQLQDAYNADITEATKRLRISKEQIEGLQAVVALVKGTYKANVKHIHDTLRIFYSDNGLTQTTTIVNDTADVCYEIDVPITLTQYWHRSWLLGRKQHFVDGYSTNPNAHITGLQSVRIEAKEPGRFGIGPYIGYSLAGPSVGIAITYSIIRF